MLFAYIDIALGSMLIQAMAGMVLAGIVMGRQLLTASLTWIRPGGSEISASDCEDELLD